MTSRSKPQLVAVVATATLVAAGLGLGCSPNAAGRSDQSNRVVVTYGPVEPEVNPEELFDVVREAHQAEIELIAAGDDEASEEQAAITATALRRATEVCIARSDCGVDELLAVVESLLGHSSEAMLEQVARLRSFEGLAALPPEIELDPELDSEALMDESETGLPNILDDGEVSDWLTLNGPVKAEIDDWLTWRRPLLMQAWDNYRYLRHQMAPIFEEQGLPEALLFGMVATESGGKVHAHSRAGAAGPLQFMSYTGRRYGLGVVDGFDLRLDPEAATRAAAAYLKEQLAALDQNLDKALAAYNGGENRMRGLHRRTRGASLWDSRVYWSLPRETREYVPRILAAARIFEHPEQFNLELPGAPVEIATLKLGREAALDELTVCLGQAGDQPNGWFRALRNLNPRLGPGDPLPAGTTITAPASAATAYRERCLEGPLVELAQELRAANYPPEPPMIRYTVRRGDTLSRIASRHRCASVREISALNGIRAPKYIIRVGQRLKIPTCG